MTKNTVIFSHGKESGPYGSKIKHLIAIAQRNGFDTTSIDYRDLESPDERVVRLQEHVSSIDGNIVLVGSSMGGYVSTVVSEQCKPEGLFLMAPAFYMPGYDNQNPKSGAKQNMIVFGWNDEVIPFTHGLKFAEHQNLTISLVNSDHRLKNVLPYVGDMFDYFLKNILKTTK